MLDLMLRCLQSALSLCAPAALPNFTVHVFHIIHTSSTNWCLFLLQLDSATSLIQAAKNLMNAVVYAVKASYVASTKHKGRQVSLDDECIIAV